MKFLTLCLVGLSICGAYSAIPHLRDSCSPPNGGGLMSVIEDFGASVPQEKFAKIALKASTSDPEVKAIMEYGQSKEYIDVIMGMIKSREYQELVKFACEKLFIDLSGTSDFSPHSVDVPEFPAARSIRSRHGIVGMLLDMFDVMPFDKLEASFNQKYSKDAYLREAVKNLNSEEFKTLLARLENGPEAQTFIAKLQEIGVNYEELKETYYKFFYYIFKN